MQQDLANPGNTINITMASKPAVVIPAASSYGSDVLTASPTVAKRVGPLSGSKFICYDTETTDTVPTNSRLLVVSFWDLSLPVSEMVTFADFDEELLTHAVADYLNEQKPDALIQYNNGFDERFLLTRFMLYQTPVPGWNDIQQIDLMQILQRGTTQNISSSQAVGTEESWLDYFFDEKKPFTIE
jgi:DNA polymerase III epsilon subunit-like protein